jgi:hypothetical protein
MARGRGILLSGSYVLTLKGTRVLTFYGCDEEYLALDGIHPGDFVTFGLVASAGHACNIRKAVPTDKERTKHADLFTAAAKEIADEKARLAALRSGKKLRT